MFAAPRGDAQRPSGGRAGADDAHAAEFVAAIVRPEIRALSAYAVAHAGGMIKLDAMENPYPLPQAVRERLAAAVAAVPVNRYPDGGADAVKSALRRAFGIPGGRGAHPRQRIGRIDPDHDLAVARPGASILAPEPSFVMYRLNALYAGVRFVGVPLLPDFSLDTGAVLAAIERERPALIFLAYPNNPTGNLFAAAGIEAILRAAPGMVVVDEAYHAFADASFLPRLADFPNLVVLRTVSKIGMAGLRLGYAVAAAEWTTELNKVRQPYNLNALTQAVAPFCWPRTPCSRNRRRGSRPSDRACTPCSAPCLTWLPSRRRPTSCWRAFPMHRAGSNTCGNREYW